MSTIKVNTIQSNTTAGVDVNSPLETVPSIDVTGSASIGGGGGRATSSAPPNPGGSGGSGIVIIAYPS